MQSDKAFLVALKAAQQGARLADDEASSLVKEAARARVEGLLDAAVKCIRQRSRVRDYTGALHARLFIAWHGKSGMGVASGKCIRQRSRVRDYTGAVGAATA